MHVRDIICSRGCRNRLLICVVTSGFCSLPEIDPLRNSGSSYCKAVFLLDEVGLGHLNWFELDRVMKCKPVSIFDECSVESSIEFLV